MQLSGHPLIDAGLATAAIIAGKESIEDVTSDDLSHAVKRLLRDLGGLQGLKVLTIYWHNNPLFAEKPPKNRGEPAKYRALLESLASATPSSRGGYCQLCGASPVFTEANRSWFPLVGSPDSDPNTLPGLGGKTVCADCLRAVVLLPLSCRLCKGGAYLFHVGDPQLQIEATAEAFRKINTQLITAKADRGVTKSTLLKTETTLSGRLELLEIVSKSVLWNHTHPERLSRIPPDGATIISFRNGDPPSVYQLHLPAQALEFLSALIERHRDEIFLKWAKDSKFEFFDRICDDIETRRSLAPIVAALVKRRPEKNRGLTKEEIEVLHIYEDTALHKKERFDALERIAREINDMKPIHRDSFIKRLAGMRSKDSFWQLLTEFKRRTNLQISASDLRLIGESFETETISLLYLLCTAEQ
jgi:hypothetical protein